MLYTLIFLQIYVCLHYFIYIVLLSVNNNNALDISSFSIVLILYKNVTLRFTLLSLMRF